MSNRVYNRIDECNEKSAAVALVKGRRFTPLEVSGNRLDMIEWVSADCTSADGVWHLDFILRSRLMAKQAM
jgi:adenine-specific DNA-methyltransferase